MNWIYIKSEPTLWTVGYYRPDGKWESESDHDSPVAAASRVHYLRGGGNKDDIVSDLLAALKAMVAASQNSNRGLADARELADAAIAKAER